MNRLNTETMKLIKTIFLLSCIGAPVATAIARSKPATIHLTVENLMHEMRVSSWPSNGSTVNDRKVSFQWPLPPLYNKVEGSGLDGVSEKAVRRKTDKSSLKYYLRYSQDPTFKTGVTETQTQWPFYNPDNDLKAGKWYWQYGYDNNGKQEWQSIQEILIESPKRKFCPPAYKDVIKNLPTNHPRILITQDEWDGFINRSKGKPEYKWYIHNAQKILATPMKSVKDINVANAKKLTNEVKKKAWITRESRRIIDAEEKNTEILIRAYLLTKDKKYAAEAIKRVSEMADWDNSSSVAGDFNAATLLSLCSLAYDSFYNILTTEEKNFLREQIVRKGRKEYDLFNNYLENYIADNHVWQMTFRIFTMAAFSIYGEEPEAATWTDYCYNLWVARFPGLNTDGGWHNGDSYFMVNARTLIEVPYFYSRLSGYDFFSDPWYTGNILYTMYEQPPFSKSGGNGSSHQKVLQPSAVRIGYLDALARMTDNTYAADFVRRTLEKKPDYLRKAFGGKSGDLTWFRLRCNKPLPTGAGLASLPDGHVFPETGLAAFMTDWDNYKHNAMLTFRSSPYGSTSHALANQNAFNTFYGGKSLFYSSGHHIQFTDAHTMYSHRSSRAHNTILANGMGQKIGTEGYGWIPRYYTGKEINYVLGDASNAYGHITSTLWQQRFKESNLHDTPEYGWDTNHVKTFRRHIVTLGNTGLAFIYDELEADKPITWSYLLHTVLQPMKENKEKDCIHIQANNGLGTSDAYLFTDKQLNVQMTDTFFVKAVNWLRADANGNFEKYPNHWHFSATSPARQRFRFVTIIDTHASNTTARPVRLKNGMITVGEWNIAVEMNGDKPATFTITSTKQKSVKVTYKQDTPTVIQENGKTTTLTDHLPNLEI